MILNGVVVVVAVAIVVPDVAVAIVDAVAVALIAVAGVAASTAGVEALIVAADVGDLVVLLLAVAPAAPFVAEGPLLSLVPSLLLRMSKPSASNVQDMGPPGGWSRSSPIISRPPWIRASSTTTTVCTYLPTRRNALIRSSLLLQRVVGEYDPSYTCALLITIHYSHFT